MNSLTVSRRHGAKTLMDMNAAEVSFLLSLRGISQIGIDSVKGNSVTGVMLMDFCEEDVKDIFRIFKDRFLIRKLLREFRSSSQNTTTGATKQDAAADELAQKFIHVKRTNNSDSTLRYAHPVSGTTDTTDDMNSRVKLSERESQKCNFYAIQNHITELARKHRELSSDPSKFMPTIVAVHSENQSYMQSNNSAEDIKHHIVAKEETMDYRSDCPGLSSFCVPSRNVSPITNRKRAHPSQYVEITSSEHRTAKDVAQYDSSPRNVLHDRISSSSSFAIVIDDEDAVDALGSVSSSDNVRSNVSTHNRYLGEYKSVDTDVGYSDFVIVSSTITQYTANELLEKKVVRTKPTEAQRLGHILLRNAAQSAKIWNTAPLLKDIPEEQKEMFFNFVFAAAPQLREKPDLVWCRIREALQNRRKYLMDKEAGKRYPKSAEARQQQCEAILLDEPEEVDVKPILSSTGEL